MKMVQNFEVMFDNSHEIKVVYKLYYFILKNTIQTALLLRVE